MTSSPWFPSGGQLLLAHSVPKADFSVSLHYESPSPAVFWGSSRDGKHIQFLLVFLESTGNPERELIACILDTLLHDQVASSLAGLVRGYTGPTSLIIVSIIVQRIRMETPGKKVAYLRPRPLASPWSHGARIGYKMCGAQCKIKAWDPF